MKKNDYLCSHSRIHHEKGSTHSTWVYQNPDSWEYLINLSTDNEFHLSTRNRKTLPIQAMKFSALMSWRNSRGSFLKKAMTGFSLPWLVTASFNCFFQGHFSLTSPPLLHINPSSSSLLFPFSSPSLTFLFPHPFLKATCHVATVSVLYERKTLLFMPYTTIINNLHTLQEDQSCSAFNAMWKGHYIYSFQGL